MDSEIIFCLICRQEIQLDYDDKNEVVRQDRCLCARPSRIQGMKPLDYAFKQLKEVLNGRGIKTKPVSEN